MRMPAAMARLKRKRLRPPRSLSQNRKSAMATSAAATAMAMACRAQTDFGVEENAAACLRIGSAGK